MTDYSIKDKYETIIYYLTDYSLKGLDYKKVEGGGFRVHLIMPSLRDLSSCMRPHIYAFIHIYYVCILGIKRAGHCPPLPAFFLLSQVKNTSFKEQKRIEKMLPFIATQLSGDSQIYVLLSEDGCLEICTLRHCKNRTSPPPLLFV